MPRSISQFARFLGLAAIGACCLGTSAISTASAQNAIDPEAAEVLGKLSSYLGALPSFTAQYDVDLDVITFEGEKLQFSSSGDLAVQRPDKLYVTRKGAVVDAEFILDAKALTISGSNLKGYVQFPATTIDEAVNVLRDDIGFDAPGADLLVSKPLDPASTDIVSSTHVGMAYVGGVEAHHLAFRGKTVDWQLWVQAGDRPLPLKYVITSKLVAGAPEYTLRLSNWNTSPQIDAARFTFAPKPGATKLESISVDETGQISSEAE